MHFFKMKGAWNRQIAFVYQTFVASGLDLLYQFMAEFFFSDLKKGVNVLDLGCGSGQLAIKIAQLNPEANVIGVDLSESQIRRARLKAGSLSHLSFQIGNAMELDFKDETFDIAFSIASIKHWPDPKTGVAQMRRVCKKEGWIYILEAYSDSTKKEVKNFVDYWNVHFPGGRIFSEWYFRRFVAGQGISKIEMENLYRSVGMNEIYIQQIPDQPFIMAMGR